MAEITKAVELAKKYKTILDKHGINTPLRLAHFFGQAYAESKLEVVSENLNYSAEGLLKIFKKYFNATTAKQYARQPQEIANRVYANRMGNGPESCGDGWKYRGRWFFQITGKANYIELTKDMGVDYITDPDSKLTEADAMVTAIWYWNERGLSRFADIDDVDAVSDIINIGRRTNVRGDANGYSHRYKVTQELKKLFK